MSPCLLWKQDIQGFISEPEYFSFESRIGTTWKIRCIFVSYKVYLRLSSGQSDWNRASEGMIKSGSRAVNNRDIQLTFEPLGD